MRSKRVLVPLVVLVSLVVSRSAVFLFWPWAHFDADQAVTGLMARHLAEGRALPVFQYAQAYVLVIESWLAAPVFLLAGHSSPTLLKSVPVALNVATVTLIFRILVDRARLAPGVAMVAALPVALPGPITTSALTDALGMNVEPLLFAAALWWLRERPVALGVTAAIGLLNREFTAYAITALLVVDVLRDRSRELWRPRVAAVVAFSLTWAAVGVLKQYSSPLGPGTSVDMMASATENLGVAAGFVCIEPRAMPGDLRTVLTHLLPVQLGVGREALREAGIISPLLQGFDPLWPLLAGVLLLGVGRGLHRAWRHGATPATWLGLYFVLIGAQAVLVYATTRCGSVGLPTLRYTLMALLAPVGALVLALERESVARVRVLVVGGVLIWAGLCGLDHARLLREYVAAPPPPEHRQLADFLDSRSIRFIQTDYWTGYQVAFLTEERVKPSTDFERVAEYGAAVRAHLADAVEVRRVRDERCEGATEIADWYVCPSTASRKRRDTP